MYLEARIAQKLFIFTAMPAKAWGRFDPEDGRGRRIPDRVPTL